MTRRVAKIKALPIGSIQTARIQRVAEGEAQGKRSNWKANRKAGDTMQRRTDLCSSSTLPDGSDPAETSQQLGGVGEALPLLRDEVIETRRKAQACRASKGRRNAVSGAKD